VLRRGAYKLIKSLEDDKRELYDLQKDPAETTDLAEKEPALRAEMEAELLRWQREVGAKSPVAKR
ncbi:MAG: sulfatase, partial [Bacteroidota bacterium]